MKSNYIVQAWLVLALGLCFGAALAGVQAGLSARIEANKRDETYSQVPRLVAGAVQDRTEELLLNERRAYRAVGADGRQVGWVLPARGQGFADAIELLVGLDPKATVLTGLYVLEQKETPGLGNKITDPGWAGQFAAKDATQPLTVTKATPAVGNRIGAITGATISSESVAAIVNKALADMRGALAAAARD